MFSRFYQPDCCRIIFLLWGVIAFQVLVGCLRTPVDRKFNCSDLIRRGVGNLNLSKIFSEPVFFTLLQVFLRGQIIEMFNRASLAFVITFNNVTIK